MHDGPRGTDSSGAQGSCSAAEIIQVEPLKTVLLSDHHRIDGFRCARSDRIGNFFTKDWPECFKPHGYCRVFILPNPDDGAEVWGFYTLSPSILARERTTGSEQKRIPLGLALPMMLVGFMGRHDGTPNGLGESLIVDAARRVHRNQDLAAWGLMLDSEGGKSNTNLWAWYQKQGFTAAKDDKKANKPNPNSGVMYAPLRKLIPELGSP